MMRLWYQSMTCLEESGRYGETIVQTAKDLFDGSVEVAVNGIEKAAYKGHVPGEVFRYPILKDIMQRQSINAAIAAEREGYEGFILGSFSEPFLKQTRSAVNIPVISLAESAITTAWSLTERFALVSLSPAYARRLEELVHRHGLQSRLGGTYGLDPAYTERHASAALDEPAEFLDRFREIVAKKASTAGIDLVIPAEGILNQIVGEARIREIEGVAIMDAVGVCLHHARMLVDVKSKLGLGHARKFSYPVPPREMLAKFV